MGCGIAQHSLLYGKRPHSGPQPQLGADNSDGGGSNFQESFITDEYGKYKLNSLYPKVHLGVSGRGDI